MKKTLRLVVLVALILGILSGIAIHAEIIPAIGPGQIGWSAVVLCEKLTVRESPSSSAKAVKSLEYGAHFTVYEQKDGWAQIFLSDAVDAEPAGWVNADYIAVDPAWYRTEKQTAVYAWNSTSAPKVALLDKNTKVAILKEDGDWLCVSLRGAAGWIRK